MQKVIMLNPPVYLEFLKEHGANVGGEQKAPAPADIQGLGLRNKLKSLGMEAAACLLTIGIYPLATIIQHIRHIWT